MINPIQFYIDAGMKEAQATNVGDYATAKHWAEHVSRCAKLETKEDYDRLIKVYRDAYRQFRKVKR